MTVMTAFHAYHAGTYSNIGNQHFIQYYISVVMHRCQLYNVIIQVMADTHNQYDVHVSLIFNQYLGLLFVTTTSSGSLLVPNLFTLKNVIYL